MVEESGSTDHEVEVSGDTIRALGWTGTPEELIRRSFRFLLEREPKESILPRFAITDIARYFPEYEEQARRGFA